MFSDSADPAVFEAVKSILFYLHLEQVADDKVVLVLYQMQVKC